VNHRRGELRPRGSPQFSPLSVDPRATIMQKGRTGALPRRNQMPDHEARHPETLVHSMRGTGATRRQCRPVPIYQTSSYKSAIVSTRQSVRFGELGNIYPVS